MNKITLNSFYRQIYYNTIINYKNSEFRNHYNTEFNSGIKIMIKRTNKDFLCSRLKCLFTVNNL